MLLSCFNLTCEKLKWKQRQGDREEEQYAQQRELVLSPDEGVLLVDQHEPLLHHGLLLLLVVA